MKTIICCTILIVATMVACTACLGIFTARIEQAISNQGKDIDRAAMWQRDHAQEQVLAIAYFQSSKQSPEDFEKCMRFFNEQLDYDLGDRPSRYIPPSQWGRKSSVPKPKL